MHIERSRKASAHALEGLRAIEEGGMPAAGGRRGGGDDFAQTLSPSAKEDGHGRAGEGTE
eukprot:scaffold46111_cov32-Tisochrysis_lutea.AAC.1